MDSRAREARDCEDSWSADEATDRWPALWRRDAAIARALAALCERAEGVFGGGIVSNHDPALFDIAIELAAGYTPEGNE